MFTRLNKITDGFCTVVRLLRSGSLSSPAGVTLDTGCTNIAAQYASTRQDLIADLYDNRDLYRTAHATWLGYLRTLARDTLIQMANDDAPLTSLTLLAAVTELRKQMLNTADSVLRPTVSTSVASISGTGSGKLIATHLGADGLPLVFQFAEALRLQCTNDSYSGDATAGEESFSVKGTVAQVDPLAWNWPLGSAANTTMASVGANAAAAATGQLLENGGFETFTTANQPDNWTIVVGSAGSSVLKATSTNVYAGTYGLAIVGDGAELTKLTQTFGVTPTTSVGAGGTALTLEPSAVYGLNCWIKMSATPAAGVLEIALCDSGGTILQVNSVDQKITQSLTGVSTSWVNVSGFLRTPAALTGTGYTLRLRLTTAISNTKTLYLDHLALTRAAQPYAGGPFLALFGGATPYLLNDLWTVTVSNDYAGLWLLHLDRLLGLRTLGVTVPHVASSQTITEPTITAF